jgi:hypothetical protein
MSAWTWMVSGWLALWDSSALSQWLSAVFTVIPGSDVAPGLDPPAPQNMSVMVRLMVFS